MKKRLIAAVVFTATLTAVTFAQPALAQQYPSKSVRVIAAYPVGAGPDTVLRLVADRLQRSMGQTFVIENRPQANGLIAAEQAKRAPADGYTLLEVDDSHLAANPSLYKNIPYDSVKDFEPVAMLFQTNFFFVVPTNSPWKTVADLIAASKAKPGKLTHGSWGIGSVGHLGMALFESVSGTQYTHVPFTGVTMIYPAVGNGDIDWAFGTVASSGASARSGKIRYLAAAAPKRIVGFPDIPTIAEAGGPPDFEVRAWVSLMAPRGVPRDIITRLNSEIGKALAEPEVREKMNAIGFEPFIASPAEVSRSIELAQKRYGDIIKRSKISLD